MRTRGPEIWAKWRELVAEQERSDQSVAAFCRARGLSPTHFFAWKKRLILAVGGVAFLCEAHLRVYSGQRLAHTTSYSTWGGV